ncbi:MAG TPA: MFS transporter [Nitrospira sp.]|nr:MFS transporter [Nitrospira sp.]
MSTLSLTLKLPFTMLGRDFFFVWASQLLSRIGAGMTGFGLGVWLFQRTGSVLDFSGIIVFGTLPGLLITPWAGSIADRHDRRTIIIGAESLVAVSIATIGCLVWFDRFDVWHLYAIQAIISISVALQEPAAYAAISSLVPKHQFGRASGMLVVSSAMPQLIAPLMAGMLIDIIGLPGIIALDLGTLIFSLSLLLAVSFPPLPRLVEETLSSTASSTRRIVDDFSNSLIFFKEHPTMALVYGYLAIGAFLTETVAVLVTPLVLSIYSAPTLALIMTSAAAGALTGGLVISVGGGPSRWTVLILFLNVLEGLAIAIAGITTSVVGLCFCAFSVMLCNTTFFACVESLSRRKVPLERQGRVFALRQFITLASVPLSAIIGGMLVQYVFEPALLRGGQWSGTVGDWFGTGPGRGTGLFFLVIGILGILISLLSMTHRRLQKLEQHVPDAC